MPVTLLGGPFKAPIAGLHRFTVAQYHKMLETRVLTENDRVELLEGYVVDKTPDDLHHDGVLEKMRRRFDDLVTPRWEVGVRAAVTLGKSVPEPDLVVVRASAGDFVIRY